MLELDVPMRTASVLILYTGGTIGMRQGAHGWTPDPNFAARVVSMIMDADLPCRCNVQVLAPLIDSAEAVPGYWFRLARLLWAQHTHHDGFVVLHGTDTLAYTASALSFLLLGFGKPVAVTGAQIPAIVPGSDGRKNMLGAIRCATSSALREVCVVFGGLVMRGNRTRKSSSDDFRAFSSPRWPLLGRLDDDLRIATDALLRSVSAPTVLPLAPNDTVGLLKLYPGMASALIEAAGPLHRAGLVLEMYGAGTGPARDVAMLRALARLVAGGVPVVGISQCLDGSLRPEIYEAGRAFTEAGVINGLDLTVEAALAKLTYLRAAGRPVAEIAAMIPRNLAGEVTPPAGR